MTPERRAWLFYGLQQPTQAERTQLHTESLARFGRGDSAAWYRREAESARRLLPGWAYHRGYVAGHALEVIGRVTVGLGTGECMGKSQIPPPWWWTLHDQPTIILDQFTAPGRFAFFMDSPASYRCLGIDRATGEWAIREAPAKGDDLVSLTEHLLGLTTAKAAWKLAKIIGLKEPRP